MTIDVQRLREKRKPKTIRLAKAEQILRSEEHRPTCELRYRTSRGHYRLTINGKNVGLDLPKSLAFECVVNAKNGDVQKAFEWVILTDPWDPHPWDGGVFSRLVHMVWRQYLLSDNADHLGAPRFRVVDTALRLHRARRNPANRSRWLYTSEVTVTSKLPADFEIREGFTIEEARSI